MATINIFGEIGWEVEASTVINLIQDTKDDEINVIISSGGGSAFEGLMIYDALKSFSGGLCYLYGGRLSRNGRGFLTYGS
jgi:ATP-dependent protease ClpP protease subunit